MGRYMRKRETRQGDKEGSAAGRLLWLVIIVALTAGNYWVAHFGLAWLRDHPIEQYRETIMALTSTGKEMEVLVSIPLLPFNFPVHALLRFAIAIFLDVAIFTLIVFAWKWLKPSGSERPEDQWSGRG